MAAQHAARDGLQCNLYPPGTEPSKGIPVSTDGDARFYAVKAAAQDSVQHLTLNCKDAAGRTSSFPVDLTSSETFLPHPLNLANEKGRDRPALKGYPQSYSEAQLIQSGYGLRPDPTNNPAA